MEDEENEENTELNEKDGGEDECDQEELNFQKIKWMPDQSTEPKSLPRPVEDPPITGTVLQANISSLLFIIANQHALLAEMLNVLIERGVINHEALIRISSAADDLELNDAVYKEIYKDYAKFYMNTRLVLMNEELRVESEERAAQQLRDIFEDFNTPGDENLPKEE